MSPSDLSESSGVNGVLGSHPAPVDLRCLERIAGGDGENLQELADSYLRTAREQLARLDRAVHLRQAKDVKELAHSCIGCSALLGMRAIVPPLRRLERMGMKRQGSSAEDAL